MNNLSRSLNNVHNAVNALISRHLAQNSNNTQQLEQTVDPLTNPISLPTLNAPISRLNKQPIGTFPLSSLPSYDQAQLLQNTQIVTLQNMPLPDNFDARQKWPYYISQAFDQIDCGSCWAFSTAIVLSDRLRIQYQPPELMNHFNYQPSNASTFTYRVKNNISPYQLVFCDLCGSSSLTPDLVPVCDFGCSGGVLANAFDYLIERGANTILATYPQPPVPDDPSTFICGFTNKQNIYKGKSKFVISQPNDSNEVIAQKIREEVFTNGPVSAAFSVYQSFYDFFKPNPTGISTSRIYTAAIQPRGDVLEGAHAISIIGWGIEDNIRYWIIRNSWGSQWNGDGFFKIEWNWTPPNWVNNKGQQTISILSEVWGIRV